MAYFFRRLTLLVLIIGGMGSLGMSQISILVVDDSDDGFGHISDFENVVGDLGYTFASYDAEGTGMVPTSAFMQAYDLVIWHTGADFDNLALWSFADTTNPELEAYLNGGGNLWLIGTDFLFDRYGAAPVSFFSGSFGFDYLGITSYDVQSYIDDSSTGLPMAIPDLSSPISGLPNLSWIFSTLWYADGVTPISGGALPVYAMGDSSYVFNGRTCGVWFDNGSSKNLSFYFNVSQISDSTTMSTMTDAVLGYFSSQIVGVEDRETENSMVISPNPAAESFGIRLGEPLFESGELKIYSLTGELVYQRKISLEEAQTEIWVSDASLERGMYLIKVSVGESEFHGSLIRQ